MPRRAGLVRFLAITVVVALAAACGGGGSSGVPGATFTVHAKDNNRFDQSTYSAPAGNIVIGYKLDGSLHHTLLIDGQNGFKLEVGSNQTSTSGPVTLPAGTYTLYCDVPGHREDGMSATLTVK